MWSIATYNDQLYLCLFEILLINTYLPVLIQVLYFFQAVTDWHITQATKNSVNVSINYSLFLFGLDEISLQP